jgi:hypothetical protein
MLVVSQLVKKRTAFYEIPNLIIAFTRICHFNLDSIHSQISLVKIRFIIIFQCTPWSSKFFNPFRVFHRKSMYAVLLFTKLNTRPSHLIHKFDRSNSNGEVCQSWSALIFQLSVACCYLLHLRSKYFRQRHFLIQSLSI